MKTRRRKVQPLAVAVFRLGPVEGEVVVRKHPKQGSILTAHFTKLPQGKHGFHIHKAGDLRGEGCKGACSHFEIGSSKHHGGPPGHKGHRHEGDLGNVEIQAGKKESIYTFHLKVMPQELWGRSIIVHADEDDLGLGPHEDSKITGHSGARIGCAIFGRGSENTCA